MSSADTLAHSANWRDELRAWLRMARVSNTPTTVSNTVAGAVLVSTAAAAGTVAVVAVAIALFSTAGMILNDVFDEAIDRRERPERPLPSGVVSRQAALLAVIVLFVAGELLLALEGWRPVVAGLGLIGLIVLYDAWHKGNALSPLLMAACRLMVYVIAGLAVASALSTELWGAAALLFVYVVGLTRVATAESGGIASRWPLLAVLAPAVYWAKELPDLAVALLMIAFLLWASYALWLVLGRRTIGAGVVRLIAGIAIYDALVVAGAGGGPPPLAVCLGAFLATIALQTKIAGT
jgi:heme O synthase-like polyprenyltransferase